MTERGQFVAMRKVYLLEDWLSERWSGGGGVCAQFLD